MSLNFENVYYFYDEEVKSPALNNISFTLGDHFFAGVIGHTGSGKSTLIQHINALLRPSSGVINVGGYKIEAKNKKKKIKEFKAIRKYAGVVFQFSENQLFEETVLKDVMFGPKNFKVSNEDAEVKAKEALKLVGLNESFYNRSPFELSGGEKRRVAIAGIISMEPSILVVDEPCAGLDPQGKYEMLELFYKLYKEKNMSIIMVSHDMDSILKYCELVLVMNKSNLLGVYKPTDLFYNDLLLNQSEIEAPDIVKCSKFLIEKGYNINKENIKDIPSLIQELRRVK